MKLLVTADLHLTDRTEDAYRWEVCTWLVGQVRLHKPDAVLILGDLTDRKNNHSSVLTNKIVAFLLQLEAHTKVVVLKGNHDYTEEQNPFFDFLNVVSKHITFVIKPTKMMLGGKRFYLLPHTSKPRVQWPKLNLKPAHNVFIHQAMNGAKDGGYEVAGATPLATLKKYKGQVLAGDIHTPQDVGCVRYVGAPYPVRFGDEYKPRVLLGSGTKWKSIPVPTISKRTIQLTVDDDVDAVFADGVAAGDHVRVTFIATPNDFGKLDKLRVSVRELIEGRGALCCGFGVQLHTDPSKPVTLTENMSPLQVLDEYCEQEGIGGSLRKVARQLLSKQS